MNKELIIENLRKIPGVCPSIANDLYRIGICNIDDLKNKNPETLYEQSNKEAGIIQDRCLLYVFRCAVYYAKTPASQRENDKLNWWNWKDSK